MSIHDKLRRVRKPRVHITYDVETEGASVKKELPFVIGVTGDFSGHNTEALAALKDRRFIQIDRDNFNDIMQKMNPKLNIAVNNTLSTDENAEMKLDLSFKSISDFEPTSVVNQVEPLKKLMATRNKLRDLMTKVDRSEDLENILEDVLNNTSRLDELAAELELDGAKE